MPIRPDWYRWHSNKPDTFCCCCCCCYLWMPNFNPFASHYSIYPFIWVRKFLALDDNKFFGLNLLPLKKIRFAPRTSNLAHIHKRHFSQLNLPCRFIAINLLLVCQNLIICIMNTGYNNDILFFFGSVGVWITCTICVMNIKINISPLTGSKWLYLGEIIFL